MARRTGAIRGGRCSGLRRRGGRTGPRYIGSYWVGPRARTTATCCGSTGPGCHVLGYALLRRVRIVRGLHVRREEESIGAAWCRGGTKSWCRPAVTARCGDRARASPAAGEGSDEHRTVRRRRGRAAARAQAGRRPAFYRRSRRGSENRQARSQRISRRPRGVARLAAQASGGPAGPGRRRRDSRRGPPGPVRTRQTAAPLRGREAARCATARRGAP